MLCFSEINLTLNKIKSTNRIGILAIWHTSFYAFLFMFLTSCSSIPSWVHKLPAGCEASKAHDLYGTWIRRQASIYGPYQEYIKDKVSYSSESIQIDESGFQLKHILALPKNDRYVVSTIIETGTFKRCERLLLLEPIERIEYEDIVFTDQHTRGFRFPNPSNIVRIEKGWPLLYFIDERNKSLIPYITYKFGKLYASGIFEGTQEPFDSHSLPFLATAERYGEKESPPHSYKKKK